LVFPFLITSRSFYLTEERELLSFSPEPNDPKNQTEKRRRKTRGETTKRKREKRRGKERNREAEERKKG